MNNWLLQVLPRITTYSILARGYVFNDFNELIGENYRISIRKMNETNVIHPFDLIESKKLPEILDIYSER